MWIIGLKDNALKQIEALGVKPVDIEKQIQRFKDGFPYLNIVKAAVPQDGIIQIEEKNVSVFVNEYNSGIKKRNVSKFVPASGAATRMFKMPFEFMNWYDGSEASVSKFLEDKSFYSAYSFIANINHFAFVEDIKLSLRNYEENFDVLMQKKKYH